MVNIDHCRPLPSLPHQSVPNPSPPLRPPPVPSGPRPAHPRQVHPCHCGLDSPRLEGTSPLLNSPGLYTPIPCGPSWPLHAIAFPKRPARPLLASAKTKHATAAPTRLCPPCHAKPIRATAAFLSLLFLATEHDSLPSIRYARLCPSCLAVAFPVPERLSTPGRSLPFLKRP